MMGWEAFQGAPGGGISYEPGSGMPTAPQDEALVALVDQVKNLKRSDPEAKEQWVAYVKQGGRGKMDPNKHSPEFLQAFIAQLQSGQRLPTLVATTVLGGEEENGLVAQIKELQRRDPDTNEQWVAYADLGGRGIRDPSKHSPESLEAFLAQMQSGARIPLPEGQEPFLQQAHSGSSRGAPMPAGEESWHLEEVFKLMQRKSTSFKNIWGQFCQEYGGQMDPANDTNHHVKFFDFLAHQACDTMSSLGPPAGLGGEGGGPAKRLRDDFGFGVGTMGGGSQKEQLVAQMKAFQRMGPGQKDLWDRYADTYLQGIRDPSRHDEGTLQEFCDNHNVPKVESVSLGGLLPAADRMNSMMPGLGGGEKEELVNQVKAFQRMGTEHNELWSTYADTYLQGARDPSRHDAPTLREFCENHNVPKVDGSSMPMAAATPGMSTLLGAVSADKQQYVNQVAAFQQMGKEQNDLWCLYADTYLQGIREPARHEAATLRDFCDNYSVPPNQAMGQIGAGVGGSL